MKRCSCCKKEKSEAAFVRFTNPYGRSYLQSWCKECKAKAAREKRAKYPPLKRERPIFPIGSKHWSSKLEESDIPLIRGLLADGLTCAAIGEKFEVSRQAISEIKRGRTWCHV